MKKALPQTGEKIIQANLKVKSFGQSLKPVYHLLFNSMKEERKEMINSSSQMLSKALLFSYGSEADEFNFFWGKLWKAVLFAFYHWEMPG